MIWHPSESHWPAGRCRGQTSGFGPAFPQTGAKFSMASEKRLPLAAIFFSSASGWRIGETPILTRLSLLAAAWRPRLQDKEFRPAIAFRQLPGEQFHHARHRGCRLRSGKNLEAHSFGRIAFPAQACLETTHWQRFQNNAPVHKNARKRHAQVFGRNLAQPGIDCDHCRKRRARLRRRLACSNMGNTSSWPAISWGKGRVPRLKLWPARFHWPAVRQRAFWPEHPGPACGKMPPPVAGKAYRFHSAPRACQDARKARPEGTPCAQARARREKYRSNNRQTLFTPLSLSTTRPRHKRCSGMLWPSSLPGSSSMARRLLTSCSIFANRAASIGASRCGPRSLKRAAWRGFRGTIALWQGNCGRTRFASAAFTPLSNKTPAFSPRQSGQQKAPLPRQKPQFLQEVFNGKIKGMPAEGKKRGKQTAKPVFHFRSGQDGRGQVHQDCFP